MLRPLAVLIVLVAAGVRVYRLGADDFWVDEAYSLAVARSPLADVLWPGRLDFHPPAFYLLLKAWVPLAGTSVTALRALPALIGVASVLAMGCAARAAGGSTVAWLAVLLTATCRLHVTYSRELRGYGLLFLGVALLLFARSVRSPLRVALRVLLALTHFQGAVCVALEALWDLARREHSPRAFALQYGPAALAALPYLLVSATYAGAHGRVAEPAGLAAALIGLAVLFGSMTLGVGSPAASLFAAGLHAAPVIAGQSLRATAGLPPELPRGLLALLAFGPFALGAVLPGSLRVSGMMAPLAPMLLLSALGLAALPRALAGALLAAIVVTSAVALTDLYRAPIHQQWRDVAAVVREHAARGATACTTDRDDALALSYHLGSEVLTCDPAPHFPRLGAVPALDPAAHPRLAIVHAPFRREWDRARPAGYRELEMRAFPRQFPLEVRLLERAPTPPPTAPR